jgi:hypothetical protein
MRKRTKKNDGEEGEYKKERNRSSVGIQPTTTIIIVINIRCNSCSLMK